MTVAELADFCEISVRQVYNLRSKYPDAPSLQDAPAFKKFVDARRVVVAERKHAPRSSPDAQTDHARYIRARADRTESLAAGERIRLELTRRGVIERAEVEAEFARCARVVRAHILRLAADAPCALSGRTEVEIDQWMQEAIRRPLEHVKLDPAFLEPKKGPS